MTRRTPLRLVILATVLAAPAAAQPSSRYTVGGRDIVAMTFANAAIGQFPSGIQMLNGIMDVAVVKGQNMLRASARSSFLVQLPEVLPQDFTLEFDIVPKAGGNPEDLAVEGTPAINQGANSANVMWHRENLWVVGGGQPVDSRVPPSFAATLPNMLTQVVIAMQGETMQLYTNGRLMMTLPNRKFVRSRVLRVFLGGQDDGPNAVYLASFRVVANTGPVGPIAARASGSTSGSGGGGAAGAAGATTGTGTTGTTVGSGRAGGTGTSGAGRGSTTGSATGTTGGGTVVPVAPSARTAPTLMPAPFNNSSSLTNVTPPVQPPGIKTTNALNTPAPAMPPAGPEAIGVGGGKETPGLFGAAILWLAVPNAVTYRIYRGNVSQPGPVQIHLTIPASEAEAAGALLGGMPGIGMLIDPYFTLSQPDVIYWVDATFADGSISSLSPNATLKASNAIASYDLFTGALGPTNLKAVVGPPTQVTGPNGQTMPGRNVTWTWDPMFVVLYEVDIGLLVQGAFAAGFAPFRMETLLSANGPLAPSKNTLLPVLSPFSGKGYASGPPYTVGIPSGSTAGFCVGAARTPGQPVTTAGRMTSCLSTQVP